MNQSKDFTSGSFMDEGGEDGGWAFSKEGENEFLKLVEEQKQFLEQHSFPSPFDTEIDQDNETDRKFTGRLFDDDFLGNSNHYFSFEEENSPSSHSKNHLLPPSKEHQTPITPASYFERRSSRMGTLSGNASNHKRPHFSFNEIQSPFYPSKEKVNQEDKNPSVAFETRNSPSTPALKQKKQVKKWTKGMSTPHLLSKELNEEYGFTPHKTQLDSPTLLLLQKKWNQNQPSYSSSSNVPSSPFSFNVVESKLDFLQMKPKHLLDFGNVSYSQQKTEWIEITNTGHSSIQLNCSVGSSLSSPSSSLGTPSELSIYSSFTISLQDNSLTKNSLRASMDRCVDSTLFHLEKGESCRLKIRFKAVDYDVLQGLCNYSAGLHIGVLFQSNSLQEQRETKQILEMKAMVGFTRLQMLRDFQQIVFDVSSSLHLPLKQFVPLKNSGCIPLFLQFSSSLSFISISPSFLQLNAGESLSLQIELNSSVPSSSSQEFIIVKDSINDILFNIPLLLNIQSNQQETTRRLFKVKGDKMLYFSANDTKIHKQSLSLRLNRKEIKSLRIKILSEDCFYLDWKDFFPAKQIEINVEDQSFISVNFVFAPQKVGEIQSVVEIVAVSSSGIEQLETVNLVGLSGSLLLSMETPERQVEAVDSSVSVFNTQVVLRNVGNRTLFVASLEEEGKNVTPSHAVLNPNQSHTFEIEISPHKISFPNSVQFVYGDEVLRRSDCNHLYHSLSSSIIVSPFQPHLIQNQSNQFSIKEKMLFLTLVEQIEGHPHLPCKQKTERNVKSLNILPRNVPIYKEEKTQRGEMILVNNNDSSCFFRIETPPNLKSIPTEGTISSHQPLSVIFIRENVIQTEEESMCYFTEGGSISFHFGNENEAIKKSILFSIPNQNEFPKKMKKKTETIRFPITGCKTTSKANLKIKNSFSSHQSFQIFSISPPFVKLRGRSGTILPLRSVFSTNTNESVLRSSQTSFLHFLFKPISPGTFFQYFCIKMGNEERTIKLEGVCKEKEEDNVQSPFFSNRSSVCFPTTSLNHISSSKLFLGNKSPFPSELIVNLPIDSPFSLLHNHFKIQPQSFVLLPIHFSPTNKGRFTSDIVLKDKRTGFTSCIELLGACQ